MRCRVFLPRYGGHGNGERVKLADYLSPVSRAALDSLARELRGDARERGTRHHYAASPVRGGATRGDQISELNLYAVINRIPLGGDKRYAWQKLRDHGGTFYRCRVTRWGRVDVNSSTRVVAHTLRELWDALAMRDLIPRRAAWRDDYFLTFLMLGNVTPRDRDTRDRSPFTGTPRPFRYVPPRPVYYRVNGKYWQLVRVTRDGRTYRQLAPADPKRGDALPA